MPENNIRQEAIQGVQWSSVWGVSTVLFQLLQMVILARLLSPSDFGLMAVLLILLGFIQCVSDMGLSHAFIQNKQPGPKDFSCIFWISLYSGILLSIFIFFTSPFISQLFNNLNAAVYIQIFSPIFLIISFGQPFYAFLQKELNFSFLTKAEVSASIAALTGAVISALFGAGVISLIIGQYLFAGVKTGAVTLCCIKKIRLYHPFQFGQIGSMLKFGLYQMGERLLGYANLNVDKMLISRWLGVISLGQYSVIYQLMSRPVLLFTAVIYRVSFPVLSKVQTDKERLRNAYLQSLQLAAFILIPFYTILMALSQPLVFVLLGESWSSTHPIFRILCVTGMLIGLAGLTTPLLLALGRADLGFGISAFLVAVSALAIWLGSHWGMEGICWALAIVQFFVFTVIDTFLVWRFIGLPPFRLFNTIFPATLISIITSCAVYFSFRLLENNVTIHPFVHLVSGCGAAVVGYGALSWLFQRASIEALGQFIPKMLLKN